MSRDNHEHNATTEIAKDFASGAVAGVVIAYSTFPAEAAKKRYQTGLEHNGFRYYRGSLLFAGNIIPTTAIQLGTDKALQQWMPENAALWQQLLASAFCGVVGALTATPVENTVVRQQVMKVGAKDVIKDLYAQGILRFWKTFALIAARDAIFTMFMMSILPAVNRYTEKNLDERYHVAANVVGAWTGAVLSHPFDMVATNIQKTHQNISAKAMTREIYLRDGARGFYKGLPFRLFLFTAFAYGIPQFKQAADHYLFGRAELPKLLTFFSAKNAVSSAPSQSLVEKTEMRFK